MFLKKMLVLLLTAISFQTAMAQKEKNYTAQWTKVEGFEKKGLTKSALKQVESIYKLALQDKNDAQQIKSSMYQIKYRNLLQEESGEQNIFFVDTLIAKATTPAKNILQSMQAEMYWQYLQNNRWKFYDRTKLSEEKSKDISTWSLDKLHGTISKLYEASLNNDVILKQTKLEGLDAIIIKGENTRYLRPALFDFLAHRALEYFVTDERDLTKPAYQFSINDPKAFAPAAEFVKASFATKDTSSLHHKAILLLQEILQFHLSDAKSDALLDADLIRLNFINQYAINEDKGKLYETALKNIEDKYADDAGTAQAIYLRAKIYYDKGQDFEPFTKTDNQYEIKRAKELCETAIKKFPKSEGGINCQNLLNQVSEPSLSLETEQVNVPGQPFRTLVKYKNAKTVFFRIIKTTKTEIEKEDNRDYDKLWKAITGLTSIKSWSINMPDPLDYQGHAAEIKVDALPVGTYYILASLEENFSLQKNIIAKQVVYVSNISYIHNNTNEYYVLNRDNGQPLSGAKAQLWQRMYDYKNGGYNELKKELYTADKNGYFKIKETKESIQYNLQFMYNGDELFLSNYDYQPVYNSYSEAVKPVTFLFSDRSIYRPGQTIYFKGIVLKNKTNTSVATVLPGFHSSIILRDANGQKVSDIAITTNEYGSYHGSFKLPEGGLNGQFSLYDTVTYATQYFSVEEYKRPKFATAIQKPTGTYRVNDSITVTGTAKAYAGNNVDGAAVKYRVVRKVKYPIWFGWVGYIRKGGGRFPGGRNEQVEITNGTTTTDNKGEFKIVFKALPDESIDKKDQPTFYYEVSADVTDVNGETRSGETSVAVAYQMLKLEIEASDKMNIKDIQNIKIKSSNINDIFEKTEIEVSTKRLTQPDKIFRERYWQIPDQFVMSKDEYYSFFPYDAYKDENQINKWQPDGTRTFSTTRVFTNENGATFLPFTKRITFESYSGWYKMTVTAKDKYGEEVKAEKYFQLFDDVPSKMKNTEPVTVDVSKEKAEPGEKINYSINTGFENIWLINSLLKVDKTITTTYQSIKSSQPYQNEIAVTENDRGGIGMNYVFVQHNRVYKGQESFSIPWGNKELTISYGTFRDKLLPGSQEKWSIKISGNKGDKAAAEMLAGMYDASLDQFKPHSWNRFNIWPELYNNLNWSANGFESEKSDEHNEGINAYLSQRQKTYDQLLSSGNDIIVYGYGTKKKRDLTGSVTRMSQVAMAAPEADLAVAHMVVVDSVPHYNQDGNAEVFDYKYANTAQNEKLQNEEKKSGQSSSIQIRKNFNETAFFFPDLKTDAEGNVSFSFTMPEALTQWKLMTLAHTKELASGYSEKTVITQKPLMVQPNAPRFMREGDHMEFTAKIVNLSDSELTGTATLELLDAATNKPIDGWFKNVFPSQYFTVEAGQSAAVKFPMEIPFNFNSAMTYRIVAKAKDFSDGEEMALPILTNRMLVTESMPINLRGTNKKDFKFEKLLNSGSSQTISNHALTVEYTSNPAWYAIQALPYLMDYPYECAEQTFNRYYANTLAAHISNAIPKIKAVFEKWKTTDTAALMSNLQKNEELKSVLLQETPWVMDAQNEAQQKKNIALLFDMVKMNSETNKAIAKLKEMQSPNGGFVWFKGGQDDRYITQYIITGIGHLKKLNALSGNESDQLKDIMGIVKKALPYLDKKIKGEYDNLIKYKADLKKNNLSYTAIQYLYMRSFFMEDEIDKSARKAFIYFMQQSEKFWVQQSKYMQAMIALTNHRFLPFTINDKKIKNTPLDIIKSLKENSINNEELGMYWKEWNTGGYYWHQAPIESQALMIEAFTEIDKNQHAIDDLKTWLLKQKQTQNWKTTKATAEACYALLLSPPAPQRGVLSSSVFEENEVTVTLGSTIIKNSDNNIEAGTGYFKKKIEGKEVKPNMGNIEVSINLAGTKIPPLGGGGASWGSVYWQYFEDLDKITPSATPLKLVKKLFIEKNTDKGPALEAIEDGATLKVGDKVKIRIELRVDRDMEYVHMKDMRAACMEPVNVISEYKYQGGLGYYESTKDASTNFFFGWLNKGSYVFEYSLFVTHAGEFSNGITTIQCMYAPEFTSHSEGVRVTVE